MESLNPLFLVIFLSFTFIFIFIAFIFRKSSLRFLKLGSGENLLLKEQPIRILVESTLERESIARPLLLLTSHRFVIAQRPLFMPHKPIRRYEIYFSVTNADTSDIRGSFNQGIISFVVDKEEINFKETDRGVEIKFAPATHPSNGLLGEPLSVTILTKLGEQYKKYLQ